MELRGRIIAALELHGGVSQRTGNTWKSQEFVIETTEGQYTKKCVFEVFGEDKLKSMNITVGEYGIVSFDIDCRECFRRDGSGSFWVNQIRAWRFIHTDGNFNPISSPQTLPLGATGNNQNGKTAASAVDAILSTADNGSVNNFM